MHLYAITYLLRNLFASQEFVLRLDVFMYSNWICTKKVWICLPKNWIFLSKNWTGSKKKLDFAAKSLIFPFKNWIFVPNIR